jgi:hypothetical protein
MSYQFPLCQSSFQTVLELRDYFIVNKDYTIVVTTTNGIVITRACSAGVRGAGGNLSGFF